MKSKIILIALAMLPLASIAQKNVAKLNILGLAYTNVPLYYERGLGKHIGISMGVGFLIPKKIPGTGVAALSEMLTSEGADSYTTLDIGKLKGFSLTPELKFYLGSNANAPQGFYIAPYFRYAKYLFNVGVDVKNNNTNLDVEYEATPSFTEMGAGIQLGYQWIINDRISIDWFFFGPRYSQYALGMEVEQTGGSSNIDWTNYEKEIEASKPEMPFGSINVSSTSNSAKIEWPFGMPNIRFGLSLGVAF